VSDQKIPSNIIGVLSSIFDEQYTHAQIDRLFAYADAPSENPGGNKLSKTTEWLRSTNLHHTRPLAVLGALIEETMEKDEWVEPDDSWRNEVEPAWSTKLRQVKAQISGSLVKANLTYQVGGLISDSSATSVHSLQDLIRGGGLEAVAKEMSRALEKVGSDPNAAAHYAGNILEATFKAYMGAKAIAYDDSRDTLAKLWPPVRDSIGANPNSVAGSELESIANGLNSIYEGIRDLRNKKSAAHGRTESQLISDQLQPRQARLAVHASHSLAAYVLESL
jgi:Abortive infection C-terminus